MKNVIFNYSDYEKDIFPGDPIDIRLAFFSGFRFMQDDKEDLSTLSYISFQLITEENKVLTLNINIKFDNEKDRDHYYLKYYELVTIGSSTSVQVPSLMQVSCFYKEKIMKDEFYTLYAKHISPKNSAVYKLNFNKSSFVYIMAIISGIEKGLVDSYNDFISINNYTESKTIKLNNSTFEPVAVRILKSRGIINKIYKGEYIVKFFKEKENTCFNLKFTLIEDSRFSKMINLDSPILMTESKYSSFTENLRCYTVIDAVETKFSKSATFPTNNFTIICKNPEENDIVFFDMNADMYYKIYESVYKVLTTK